MATLQQATPQGDDDEAFEDAKRLVLGAIGDCLDRGIDPALVSAVLIGAGVSWYRRFHGEEAVVGVLAETIDDIRTGRHNPTRWKQ
ncbi:MAG: hypothetical protein EAZ99_05460 [Alphaproteobacteria bacterium]|nr:hypothetical protein [Alphaproteobacteria bacterium]TAD90731.1 MAG: hypothetical protein EAZ99_05460 [Alphaproteobacteria bacterium]